MKHLGPVFLALVCSIFDLTSELPTNQLYKESGIHRTNPSLTHLHYKDKHAKTSPSLTHLHYKDKHVKTSTVKQFDVNARDKREVWDPCDPFQIKEGSETITLSNPKDHPDDKTYSSNTTCITKITARDSDYVVVLTFVNQFKIEGRPRECETDYLEIRDGEFGYSPLVDRFCGDEAPGSIISSGQHMWLKFHSDDSIEYDGFQIRVEFQSNVASRKIHPSCQREVEGEYAGEIGSHSEDVKECREQSPTSLDIQWKIVTPANTSIFLNFTEYKLALPNDCESNVVQVFGSETNFDHKLEVFCGSKSKPVTTKLPKEGFGPSNIMYVRMYASVLARDTMFKADFTAFRTLTGEESCDSVAEFDCEDGTCINAKLKCNDIYNCRLKGDEECEGEKASLLNETHILVMLIIFSIVLSAVGVFYLFTCIRKLYRDHQYIKETLQAKSQDHLDQMCEDRLSFDSNGMDRLSSSGDSPERENLANNYTRQMNERKSGSIESDLLQLNSPLDGDNDWPETTPILTDEIDIKYKNRPRRSNASKNDYKQKVDSPTIEIPKEEDRKEAEYKSRPRHSNAGNRKESLKIDSTTTEKLKGVENKDKLKRRESNRKEESPKRRLKEENKDIESKITNRSRHDKFKDELSRTNTLQEEEHKEIEHKSKSRRDTKKKEQSPTIQLSKEEESEDGEVRGKPRRNINRKEQLSTPKVLKEEESKEIEDKGRFRQKDTSMKEESLRTRTTKENVNTENKSRPRDTSKKEESLRTKSLEDTKESRDASVGTLNTMEFGCQTRESLFLTDPVTSSDGTNSSSNSRGLAFACSNATIVRPATPVNTSQVTIDLQPTLRDPTTIHADRRPMSSETTRSAPDVIIVAKRLS